MKQIEAGVTETIPTADVPKAKDANTYRVSPAMEKALAEIRFLVWLAESHDAGIGRIVFKVTETDGAFADYQRSFRPVKKRVQA